MKGANILTDKLREEFFTLADKGYADFQQRTVKTNSLPIIGVRMPIIQKMAKTLAKENPIAYINEKSEYYEEQLLKILITAYLDIPVEKRLDMAKPLLIACDNWAVCDGFCSAIKPKKEDLPVLYKRAEKFSVRKPLYLSRCGIVLLFQNFTNTPERVVSVYERVSEKYKGEYYRDMAIAWGIATLCTHNPEFMCEYIKNSPMEKGIIKMAAQKVRDSRCISREIKDRFSLEAKRRQEE